MKARRVIVELELDTEAPTGAIRTYYKRQGHLSILQDGGPSYAVTLHQVQVNVVRATKPAARKRGRQ